MEKHDGLSRRQILALSTLSLLAPALRLIPGWCAEIAGGAAWLCPLAALPVLLLQSALLAAFLKNRRPGEGLGAMYLRALGRGAGGALLFVYGLWLTFYAGFLLRSGAERFMATVYPNSGPGIFISLMLIMGLTAALGRFRALGRTAELLRPLMIAALGLALIFALWDVEPARLLPVTWTDALPVLGGAVPAADVVGLALLIPAFTDGLSPTARGRGRDFALWAALVSVFLSALIAVTVGRFGPELTARLSHPFFVLVRNTELFGVIERLEALVTALWVFPDFILVSLSLLVGSGALRLALGWPADARQTRLLCMKNGRYIILLCAAAAGGVAFLIAPTAFELTFWSRDVVPLLNMIMCFAVPALAFAAGKIRKKI